MAIPYNLSETPEVGCFTAFVDGQVMTSNSHNPNWKQLVALIDPVTKSIPESASRRLISLLNPASAVTNFFDRLSERVTISGDHVFVDGEEMNDGLTDHIVQYIQEDEGEVGPLVNFLEKVLTNPNEHSRTQLYDWLNLHKFAITPEGNFLAYKGVQPRRDDNDYPFQSISTGKATVDGQVYEGAIPNGVGAVVEMPRGDVQHDPGVGCHTGLHAGTWSYASNFSQGAVLLVEINPRDVVSVPTDCNSQKIRTCRYTVVKVTQNEFGGSYYDGRVDVDEAEDDLINA